MDIGIFTIVYNGYGRFILQWCQSISELTRRPAQVVAALFGEDHGVTNEIAAQCRKIVPNIQIIHKGNHINLGADRNKAVEELGTEWIMLLSADDIILPTAIEEFEKHDCSDIDVIACSYTSIGLNGDERLRPAPKTFLAERMLDWRNYWLSPYSPFRRSFWEEHPYYSGEFPNVQQTNSFAVYGARFARTDVPCVYWIRREDSHHECMRRSEEDQKKIDQFLDSRVDEITKRLGG